MGHLIGVDEVGRGCLAGPMLVVAARQTRDLPNGLRDSKALSNIQRIKLLKPLSNCCEFGEGWVKASEIDRLGLASALRLGTKRALVNISAQAEEEIIMDGKFNYLPKKFINSRCIIGADSVVPIVSAASIYAKVKRDEYMIKLAKRYPSYSFEKHVGYGTAEHKKALKSYGILKSVHRLSYAPITEMAL